MPPATLSPDGAEFDTSGRFRYLLWRTWDARLPRACFIMLNPSTADAITNDPTISRCISFTTAHACGGLDVVNLFAHRSTDPKLLARTQEARGRANEAYIARAIGRCTLAVAAWGVRGNGHWQDVAALRGVPLLCLGETQRGEPRHPLYVAGNVRLRPWHARSLSV